jgi:hypothetical protein
MVGLPLAALEQSYFWFAVPLVIVVSFVYSATRHEQMLPILAHALRIGIWIVAFMVVVFLVLLLISQWV